MDAATFSTHFEELVVTPASAGGFEPWGNGLWMQRGGVRAAVLRTERYNLWPFELTLVVGHDCLRDFDDRRPPPRSREPSEYPIKVRPSDAKRLLKRYRYEPYNLGRWPRTSWTSATYGVSCPGSGRHWRRRAPCSPSA